MSFPWQCWGRGFVLCLDTWPSTWSPSLPWADGSKRGPPGGLDHNLLEAGHSSGSKSCILVPPEIIERVAKLKCSFKFFELKWQKVFVANLHLHYQIYNLFTIFLFENAKTNNFTTGCQDWSVFVQFQLRLVLKNCREAISKKRIISIELWNLTCKWWHHSSNSRIQISQGSFRIIFVLPGQT